MLVAGCSPHEDAQACGAGCGGGRGGDMVYVGPGQGAYRTQQTYRYVGYGGDFTNVPRRRDFTCCICAIIGLSLLLLSLYLLWPTGVDCVTDRESWQMSWSPTKQAYCCRATGFGCMVTTPPPFVNPGPSGPVGPVDPFNCAEGFSSWESDWSEDKKTWCCNIHGRGCNSRGEVAASSYDCNAGHDNWVKAWSTGKKTWCCQTFHTGCPQDAALNEGQASQGGYGAGAKYGTRGAGVAAITGIVPYASTHGR